MSHALDIEAFIRKIDCQFPYNDECSSSTLIREGCRLGGDAAFSVVHELVGPYALEETTPQRLELLLDQWLACVNHPLAQQIGELSRRSFYRQDQPWADVAELSGQLKTAYPQPTILHVLLACCLHTQIDLDALQADVEAAWKAL